MIDTMWLRKVCLSMLFVVFFLWLHFLARLWVVYFSYNGTICNSVGPFGIIIPEWLIVSVSFVIGVNVFLIVSKDLNLSFQWPWLLIFSGGLGNLLERIFFGCIMDYVHISSFPVFNLADILLTVGALGIIIQWRHSGVKN